MKAKIESYRSWVERSDGKSLKEEIKDVLENAGFTILNFIDHEFEPQGYTAIWLLAESHCALHTFPEENRSYVEISSCNTKMFVNFIDHFTRHFNLLED